jgi:hypothetical protein
MVWWLPAVAAQGKSPAQVSVPNSSFGGATSAGAWE